MRRVLAALWAAALLVGWTLPAGAAEPAARPVTAERVSASTWYVRGEAAMGSPSNRNFVSNAGIIATAAGAVVVDALGSPQLARELITEARRVTGQAVTHVIVTHYHADHIYGLQEFQAVGARIIAHRAALEYLHSDTAAQRLVASRTELAPWVNADTRLVPADQWIDQRTELTIGGVRLVLLPVGAAHTPEDLAVILPAERVLFAGDLVFRGRIPFVGQADSGQWIKSLDALLAIDPAVIVPGHGELSRSARQDVVLTRDYLAYLRQAMGHAAREMEPFDEAYARTDWSRFVHLPLFDAANRMNAYNTYLLMERQPP